MARVRRGVFRRFDRATGACPARRVGGRILRRARARASRGARAFAAPGEVGVVMNSDARGTHGAGAMYDVSPGNGALVEAIATAAPRPITSSFICALAMALPNDSDLTVFKRAGIPSLGFAFADGL